MTKKHAPQYFICSLNFKSYNFQTESHFKRVASPNRGSTTLCFLVLQLRLPLRTLRCNCIVWIHGLNVFICYMNSCIIRIHCRLVQFNCFIWTHLLNVFICCMDSCIIWIHFLFYPYPCSFYAGINNQKKELFVMAVCSPTGKTFPGNFTIIPSAKQWVFHAIYC